MYIADAGTAVAGGIASLFLMGAILVTIAVYFVPSFIAFKRDKANKTSILVLNIFLGWSLIGWVVSLVWALANETPTQAMVVHHTYDPQAATPPQPPTIS